MANHQDRLARRQAANDELQARLAARNAAFDAVDAVEAALDTVAAAAVGKGDPLTRAERVRAAAAKVETAVESLRTRAEDLRLAERARVGDIADLLGVPSRRITARAATSNPATRLSEEGVAPTESPGDRASDGSSA